MEESQEIMTVKIARRSTNRSVIDVTSNLDNYKRKETEKKKEDEYKGKIIFSITQFDSRKYKKAFVDKDVAKMLCYTLFNLQFTALFGERGFVDQGMGTLEDGSLIARSLTIRQQQRSDQSIRFQIVIDEAPGFRTQTGAVNPIAGSIHESVMTYVSLPEMVSLAHEVYDYIRGEEQLAIQKGKPLHTLMYYSKKENEVIDSPFLITAKDLIEEEERLEDFVIPLGELKGKMLGNLSNQLLRSIITSEVETDVVNDIKRRAYELLVKRGQRIQ